MAELAGRPVNYDPAQAPPAVTRGWHRDRCVRELGREAPGEPVPGGLARTAMALIDDYAFSDARILRAVYRGADPVLGRNMLLEGRFLLLRFLLGVRITGQHDEVGTGPHGPERRTGWSYETLKGHLEQGRLTYEIAKDLDGGRVEFRITAFSRRAPIRNPVLRLGFGLFGRRTQLRFYRHALRRLPELLRDPPAAGRRPTAGLVEAPAEARVGRFAGWTLRIWHPGDD